MMKMVARMDRDQVPVFMTLTFPDELHELVKSPDEKGRIGKQYCRRFEKRLLRRWPGASAICRIEWSARKSGKYVGEIFPHIHCLVWNRGGLEIYGQLLSWCNDSWWECCGKISDAHRRAGVQVRMVYSWRGVFSYLSKYTAKVENYEFEVGRLWWCWNIPELPWVRPVLIKLKEKEAVQLIRIMRRFARIRGYDRKSLSVFCDARQWLQKLGPDLVSGPIVM
jgi:hypothetical protein